MTDQRLTPIRFTFDHVATFDGLTDGTTWNGFANVRVTPATLDLIRAHFATFADPINDDPDAWPAVGPDGLVNLSGGFATIAVVAADPLLSFDEAEAAGFDGTGRDLDPRFPYHASDLGHDHFPRVVIADERGQRGTCDDCGLAVWWDPEGIGVAAFLPRPLFVATGCRSCDEGARFCDEHRPEAGPCDVCQQPSTTTRTEGGSTPVYALCDADAAAFDLSVLD